MYFIKKLLTADAPVRTSSYRSIAFLGVLGITLTGCAAKAQLVDDSPLVRSATIVTAIENVGIKGQFASTGTRTASTVADMRREDDAFKFSGSIMSRIAKGGDARLITGWIVPGSIGWITSARRTRNAHWRFARRIWKV